MSLNWPAKASVEVLDYAIDWTSAIGTDVIAASTWTIAPSDLTTTSNTFTAKVATIWLSNGTQNQSYVVTNTITTVGGRTFEQSVAISIRAP